MKKTIVLMGGIALSLLTVSVNAQETWDAKKNPTVDSISALYRDKIVTAPPAQTREEIFPAIGKLHLLLLLLMNRTKAWFGLKGYHRGK